MYTYALIIVSAIALITAIVGLAINIRTLRRLDRRLEARRGLLYSLQNRRRGR